MTKMKRRLRSRWWRGEPGTGLGSPARMKMA